MQTIHLSLAINILVNALIVALCVMKLSAMSVKAGKHLQAAIFLLIVAGAVWSTLGPFFGEVTAPGLELFENVGLLCLLAMHTRDIWWRVVFRRDPRLAIRNAAADRLTESWRGRGERVL